MLVRQGDGARVAVRDRRFGRVRDEPGRHECRGYGQLRRPPAAAGAHVYLAARQQTTLPQHSATGSETGGLCLPIPYAYALAGLSPAGPTRPAERASHRALFSDPRIVTKTSHSGKKRFERAI